jgi:hypothetical protein
MRNTRIGATPVGEVSITTEYRRVDNRTDPASGQIAASHPSGASPAATPRIGPDWLPRYAAVENDSITEDSLSFLTADRPRDVIDFYAKSLKTAGFVIDDRPSSGSFAPIGGGELLVLKAFRGQGTDRIEFELAVLEQDATTTQVVGNWKAAAK